jgi:hypothetical protein
MNTTVQWTKVCILELLALDQVLGDPWSSLTYFGTSTACRRYRAQDEEEIAGFRPLFGSSFGIWEYVTGMECWTMGLLMFRSILYV